MQRFFREPNHHPNNQRSLFVGVFVLLIGLMLTALIDGDKLSHFALVSLGAGMLCRGLAELLPTSQRTIPGVLRILALVFSVTAVILWLLVLVLGLIE